MTPKRFLTWLWLAASAIWFLIWATMTDIPECVIGIQPPDWCEFQLPREDWAPIATFVFGVPIVGWMLGAAAMWLLRRSKV